MTGRCLSPLALVFALLLPGNPFSAPLIEGQTKALVIEQFDAELNSPSEWSNSRQRGHSISFHEILERGFS
jgi:hypothetical protein